MNQKVLLSLRVTSARDWSSPTLPAKTMYGMPLAGPSTGSHRLTMPGSMGPRTIAWRISRPWAATSEDVMPPLAMTNRGGKVFSVRFTTATTAADTVRAIRRLSAASSVLMSSRLVWTMTSPLRRASTTVADDLVQVAPSASAAEQLFDVDLHDARRAVLLERGP